MMPRELLVHGLSGRTTSDRLTRIFAGAGAVLSARVVRERRSGCSHGFVTMRSTADAQRAIRELDGQELDGRILSVEVARRPAPPPSSRASSVIAVPTVLRSSANARPILPVRAPAARIVVSFLVDARAFRYLVDCLGSLQPAAATAVEVARGRGCIAGCYYFLDLPDEVVRDVRNCLRRNGRGSDDGACVAAASAIENRRRGAWYSSSCPRCGGRFPPRGWPMAGTLVLVCGSCELLMPG